MDNGHTGNDNFEQSFINSVNGAVQGQVPVASEPVVSNGPIVSSSPEAPSAPKKKFPVFVATTIIEAVVIVVLVVVLILSNMKPSIASDASENVRLSKSGNVEAVGIYCKMGTGTLYLDKFNGYFIEPTGGGALVEVEPGVYEQLETSLETGHYTIDGNTIHFLSDDNDDYYGQYASHKLMVNDKSYNCENYD